MKSYAAYFDHEIRKHSSSGGIFALLASYYDVVYGVAMTEDCHGAEFRRMTGEISPLRGSKYVQAKVGDTFRQVKTDLESGKTVLFTGTGCQVNGLQMFLQKEYPNLLTVDVICHGTPSPKLWDMYADYRELQQGKKLKSVNFRCKDKGRADLGMKGNRLYISKEKDPFMQMFLRDYCLRPACYACHAKDMKLSDLTLADFWGIETAAPEMNDGKGTSMVITRTEKGQAVFERAKQQLKWKEVGYEEAVRFNPSEHRSAVRPEMRDSFFRDLSRISFSDMVKKYASPAAISNAVRIKRIIKKAIGKVFFKKRDKVAQNADYGLLFTFLKN